MGSLVLELQHECLSKAPVADVLRKALVVANKLGVSDLAAWLSNELYDYKDVPTVPAYRQVRGSLVAWNPYHGWIPVVLPNQRMTDMLTQVSIAQPVGELEKIAQEAAGYVEAGLPTQIEKDLMKGASLPLRPVRHITIVRTICARITHIP